MTTAKQELAEVLALQPDDSSPEELVRELAFHVMIQRGLADAEAGQTVSTEELRQRVRLWRDA